MRRDVGLRLVAVGGSGVIWPSHVYAFSKSWMISFQQVIIPRHGAYTRSEKKTEQFA